MIEVWRDEILVEQYGYDNNANRTSTISTTATYDDQDRLIPQGGLRMLRESPRRIRCGIKASFGKTL